jgi:hypothetical protein
MNTSKDVVQNIIKMRLKSNAAAAERATMSFNSRMSSLLPSFTAEAQAQARLDLLKRSLVGMPNADLADNLYGKFIAGLEILTSLRTGQIKVTNQETAQQLQQAIGDLEKSWNFTDLSEAMAFVRDDNNMVTSDSRVFRIFPSKGFTFPVNIENAVKSGIISADETDKCSKEIKFEFTERGLTREQVMMMDVIANNNWSRGIYYASPAGSDVSMALYRGRILKQNGLAYELSPLANQASPVHLDKMYEHLMKTYNFGLMKKEGVLTDYYTRRHTRQYRQHFEVLAEAYLRQAEEATQIKSRGTSFIEMMRMNGQEAQANRAKEIYENADNLITESKKKAIQVIKRSLEVMPPALVFDHGEPNTGNEVYTLNQVQYRSMTDGSLHNYVNILFNAGDKAAANKLGLELAGQLESIISYFLYNNPEIAVSPDNTADLFAAMDSYFKLSIDAMEPQTGDPKGALAKRTAKNLEQYYMKDLPAVYTKLKDLAVENGESIRSSSNRGRYMSWLTKMQDQMEAMAVHYQFRKPAAQGAPTNLNQLNLEN